MSETIETDFSIQLDEEKLQELLCFIEEKWDNIEYSLEEISFFQNSLQIVYAVPSVYAEKFFSNIGIILTKKDRQKGTKGIVFRFLKNFHKDRVRKNLESYFLFCRKENHKKEITELEKFINVRENITSILEKSDPSITFWTLLKLNNHHEVLSFYKEHFLQQYVVTLMTLYVTYDHFEYKKIMENPESLKANLQIVDPKQLHAENKMLKNKLWKIQKEENNLKQTVYKLNKEKKQLKGELYDLYQDSLKEIEDLKEQLDEERRLFEKEREYLLSIIEEYSKKNHELKAISENVLDLKGKKICVIGGSKYKQYEEVIKKYNGEIEYVSANDFRKIRGAISSSDFVFFLTELVGHMHFREAIKAADEYGVPFHYINSKGKSSFERYIQEIKLA